MTTYAPDTNFFLQCHPADQLDWKLLTNEEEVVLLVVREVRKELDRLKGGGNQRRAKRARIATALLRRFTSENASEIELRAERPRVVLRVAKRAGADALPLGYQIESSDERIVAEVYAARTQLGEQITFLSHDTVPLEDAVGLGICTQVVPDSWLLEPESSELERELGEVKRRMKLLEGRAPEIVVELPVNERGQVILQAPYFPPLSEDFIESVMREVRRKHPPGPSAGSSMRIGSAFAALERVSEERWTEYAEAHAAWLTEVEELLRDVSRYMSDDSKGVTLPIVITNRGTNGAENLIIRIEALGDFHLIDPDESDGEEERDSYFTEPPRRPQSAILEGMMGVGLSPYGLSPNLAARLSMPRFNTPSIARDRHTIYWEYEDAPRAVYVEGQCRDFRHGLKPYELSLMVKREEVDDQPMRGAVKILVSAGNLAEAKISTHPLLIEAMLMNTEDLVGGILKRELSVSI